MNRGLYGVWLGEVLPGLRLTQETRTTGKTLTDQDGGKFISIAGTASVVFPAFKSIPNDWAVILQSGAAGLLTVTPFNGAETLDSLSTYVMYTQEVRLFYKGVTGIASVVLNAFDYAFTTVGANTFVKPPGYTTFDGEMWNGGCSGQKSAAGTGAGGGGGGGCFPFSLAAALLAATTTITVGNGGAAIAAASTPGAVGGVTSIGIVLVMTVAGGYQAGSSLNGAATSPAAPLAGFDAQLSANTITGNTVYGGTASSSNFSTDSGSSVYGGAAGGSIDAAGTIRLPGTSKLGGNGGAAIAASSGTAGTAPGGGGGATQTGATSGAGARGEVRIRGKI